jgi:fumarate hydratase, class II
VFFEALWLYVCDTIQLLYKYVKYEFFATITSMPRKLYGSQTEKALNNFPISGWPMPEEFIRALALIKKHAALVNGSLKKIPAGHAKAIASAAASITKGAHMDQFPVDVFQTGSGTSTNMNMNEVLATLANKGKGKGEGGKGIHPNDHVNCSQSSNDVIPTAMQLSLILVTRDELLPALTHLENRFHEKSREFHHVVKTARTHLMDAVPVRLGDEFAAFAYLLEKASTSVMLASSRLHELPLGGTAAGTGLNAHPQFARRVIAGLKKETKLPLIESSDHIAAQSCPLAAQALSSAFAEVATVLTKIGNDIRMMNSGPVSGFNEIQIPELQPGSSIMPGKVNPVLCESVEQVCAWVFGGDAMVQQIVSHGSRFELHTCYPILACKLLTSAMLLTNVSRVFADKCIKGIVVNKKILEEKLARSAMLVTALTPHIGYQKAAEIAKEALTKGETILEVAARRTGIHKPKLQAILDPSKMV